jgi:hypothetical protein
LSDLVKVLCLIDEPTPTTFARHAITDWYGDRFARMIATKNGRKAKRTRKEIVPRIRIRALKSNCAINFYSFELFL